MREIHSSLRLERDGAERSSQLLEEFFANAPVGICVVNSQGRIIKANTAESIVLNVEPDELSGSEYAKFFVEHERVESVIRDISTTGGSFNDAFQIRTVNGEFRTVELHANQYKVAGSEAFVRCFNIDVTAQTLATQALAAKERAEASNRSKTEFLSRVSHELRTPMNAILGFSQLLSLQELPGKQADWVKKILESGSNLLALINQILQVSELESMSSHTDLELIDIVDLTKSTSANFTQQPYARNAQIAVTVPTNDQINAYIDPTFYRDIMLILLDNSVRYSKPPAKISVQIIQSKANEVSIGITDNGEGIDPALHHRLFVPFDRLDREKYAIDGTGLGLSRAKAMVEAMGGKISLDRSNTQGTRFVINLRTPDTNLFERGGSHAA